MPKNLRMQPRQFYRIECIRECAKVEFVRYRTLELLGCAKVETQLALFVRYHTLELLDKPLYREAIRPLNKP